MYALEGLRTPSRFDIPLVQEGTELIDRELERGRQEATRNLDEHISSRGLVGSNVEAEERRRLLEGLEDQRRTRLHDLNLQMAGTHAGDRASAGHLAATTAGLGQQESQFARSFGLESSRFEEAQDQFARRAGLDESRFREQQHQFAQQMAEQVASRFQQEGQFQESLNLQESRLAIESSLQRHALALQEQGMNLDEAFRRASLEVETGLRNAALELQRYGIDQQDAYRYAALSQDEKFRTRAADLQERGMDLDDAYRTASLEYQEWATEQGLVLERARIGETSRLSELDIILRAQAAGLPVEAPDLGYPGIPEIEPPPRTEEEEAEELRRRREEILDEDDVFQRP